MVQSQRRTAPPADPMPGWVVVTARALLVATVGVVAAIVFTPGPPDESGQQALARWLDRVHQMWMPEWVTFGLVEFLSNVVMFAPLGLLGALALRRRRWIALPVCVAASGAIELTQYLALPGRDGTIQDVLANSLGALVGFGIAAVLVHRRGRARPLAC